MPQNKVGGVHTFGCWWAFGGGSENQQMCVSRVIRASTQPPEVAAARPTQPRERVLPRLAPTMLLGAGQLELTNHSAAEPKKSQSGVERPQCEVRSSYTHTVEAVFDSRVGPDRSPTAAAATGEPSYTLNSTAAGAAASARLTFGLRANSHRPLQASHGLAG